MTLSQPARAIAYLRISKTTEESTSLERQRRDITRVAKADGFDGVTFYVDDGISGGKTARQRHTYREALDDLARGDVQMYAWKLDRSSRAGLVDLAALVERLDEGKRTGKPAAVTFLKDGLSSDSPGWTIAASVLAEVAKAEREAMRQRSASLQEYARSRGEWRRPRPFGFDVVDRRLVPHEGEAEIIAEGVRRYSDGESLKAIAADLNARRVPAPSVALGHKWSGPRSRPPTWGVSSVRAMISAPTIAGLMPHKGEPLLDDEGRFVTVGVGVVTEAQWRRVRERLAANAAERRKGGGRTGGGPHGRHPLSKLVRCGCGSAMTFEAAGPPRRPSRFRCVARMQGRDCTSAGINADRLLAFVTDRVCARLAALPDDSPVLATIAEEWLAAVSPDESAEREAAHGELRAARAALADLEDARYLRGEFVGDDALKRYGRLHAALSRRVATAVERLAALPDGALDIGALQDPEILREALDGDGTLASRQAFFRACVDRVTVYDGVATVTLQGEA